MGVKFGDIDGDTVVPEIEDGRIRCDGVARGIHFTHTDIDGDGVVHDYEASYSATGFRVSTGADDGSEQYVSVSPDEITVRGARVATVNELAALEAKVDAANAALEAAL